MTRRPFLRTDSRADFDGRFGEPSLPSTDGSENRPYLRRTVQRTVPTFGGRFREPSLPSADGSENRPYLRRTVQRTVPTKLVDGSENRPYRVSTTARGAVASVSPGVVIAPSAADDTRWAYLASTPDV